MSDEQSHFNAKPKDSLVLKIFIGYLFVSIGLILGINAILFLSNTYLFDRLGIWSSILAVIVIYTILSIIFYLILKKFIKPLRVLISNIGLFLEGNWEQRTYISGNDETSVLANGINILADDLITTHIAIEKAGVNKKSIVLHSNYLPHFDFISVLQEKNRLLFYEKIYEQVQKKIGQVYFFVAEYNRHQNEVIVPYANSGDGQVQVQPFPLGGGLTSIVIKLDKPLLANTNAEMLAITGNAQKTNNRAKSWMGVPIILEDKAEGAIVAQDLDRENAFTESQLSYMQNLATLISIRWEKDRLSRDLQQIKILEEKTADITSKIQDVNNLDDLVKVFGSELRDALSAEEVEIIIQPVDEYSANSSNPPILTKKLAP